jgi:hypothetical protein
MAMKFRISYGQQNALVDQERDRRKSRSMHTVETNLASQFAIRASHAHHANMNQILAARSKIYAQFHGSSAGAVHFFRAAHAEAYAAYCTAMYLFQDTGEFNQK